MIVFQKQCIHMIENINLIRKIVWSFHYSTGLDWDDLFQEACLGYLETMERYDAKRGGATTFMWHCISSKLKTYLRKEMEYQSPLSSIEFWEDQPKDYSLLSEQLSEKGGEALKIIIISLEELSILSPTEARKKIRMLLFEKDWSLAEVRESIGEFRSLRF